MFILIDIRNKQAIARHKSYRALAALGYIQFANVDTVIVPVADNKGFAIFDKAMLRSIATNAGLKLAEGTGYSDTLRAVRTHVAELPVLEFPFEEDKVLEQAYALALDEDAPYVFNPDGTEPLPVKKWAYEPQRNVKRINSSQGVHFASGAWVRSGEPHSAERALTALPGRTRPPAPKAAPAPKAPKAPKTPAAPRSAAPSARPKAGTSTGQVWDICDQVAAAYSAEQRTSKEVRRKVIEQCEAAGINKSTASVQFGKWAAST